MCITYDQVFDTLAAVDDMIQYSLWSRAIHTDLQHEYHLCCCIKLRLLESFMTENVLLILSTKKGKRIAGNNLPRS